MTRARTVERPAQEGEGENRAAARPSKRILVAALKGLTEREWR